MMPASSLIAASFATSEDKVLLLCARNSQTAAQRSAFIAALADVSQWKILMSKLQHNGLLPLFMHHLEDMGSDSLDKAIPDDVLARLQREFTQGLQWRLNLFSELKVIMALLKARGLPALAYKGPVMAYSAYSSMALRPFSDLDLLIDPKNRHEVIALLEEHGYEREDASTLPTHLVQQRIDKDYEITLLPRTGYAFGALDVHWNLRPAYEMFSLSFGEIWSRRVSAELDSEIETLCCEDLILSLCSHGIKHIWHRLEWIACLAALIENGHKTSLDWVKLEAEAKRLRSRRIFYLGLRLAADLMDFGREEGQHWDYIPAELRHRVEADRGVARLARQVWEECLNHTRSEEPALDFKQLLFSLRVRDHWGLRLRHLVGVLKKHSLPHPEDATSASESTLIIYVRRFSRIVVRRFQRWGVLKERA